MVRQARCNRVHSAVTHQVNVIEAGKVNVHAAFLKLSSGQLPFLGLIDSGDFLGLEVRWHHDFEHFNILAMADLAVTDFRRLVNA